MVSSEARFLSAIELMGSTNSKEAWIREAVEKFRRVLELQDLDVLEPELISKIYASEEMQLKWCNEQLKAVVTINQKCLMEYDSLIALHNSLMNDYKEQMARLANSGWEAKRVLLDGFLDPYSLEKRLSDEETIKLDESRSVKLLELILGVRRLNKELRRYLNVDEIRDLSENQSALLISMIEGLKILLVKEILKQ